VLPVGAPSGASRGNPGHLGAEADGVENASSVRTDEEDVLAGGREGEAELVLSQAMNPPDEA
jgi:hypothetical protein